MPAYIVPQKLGPHRIACIALYRALLEQCSRISIPIELSQQGPINPLKHLIRKKFRQNIHVVSPRLVVNALSVGYKVEQLLRNAGDGNQAAHSQILSTLQTLQQQSAFSRSLPQPPKKPQVFPEPYPNAPKVLETRPLPLSKLGGSGRRHVPIMTGGNQIPFLRFKKPQSPFLSRVIKDKIKTRQRRLDWTRQLEEDALLGRDEDQWEELVKGVGLEKKRGNVESPYVEERTRWGDAAVVTKDQILEKGAKEVYATRTKALRFLEIAEKEKELWERGRRERRHWRNMEKCERKFGPQGDGRP